MLFAGMKTDPTLRFRWLFDHLLQHLRNNFDLVIVQLNGFSEFRELVDKFAGRRHEQPQPHKRPHNLIFTRTAVGDRSTLESIATPCSGKPTAAFGDVHDLNLISQFAISNSQTLAV
jgi:hypothetical protein